MVELRLRLGWDGGVWWVCGMLRRLADAVPGTLYLHSPQVAKVARVFLAYGEKEQYAGERSIFPKGRASFIDSK